MAITLPVSIPSTATDALQPVDEFLMKGLDTNQKYIASVIELGGGSGGGEGGGAGSASIQAQIANWFDAPISGGKTNEGRLWRRRFSLGAEWLSIYAKSGDMIDFFGNDLGKIPSYMENPKDAFTRAADDSMFRGSAFSLLKNSALNFRIKKGFNFVSFGCYGYTQYTDSVSVFVDGQTPSSLGLKDENFNISPNTFNPQNIVGAAYNKKLFTIMGLDGEEHIIQIKNTDSATKALYGGWIEFGYLSPNYTLTNKISISRGKLSNGIEFPASQFSFNDQTYSGHCGAIAVNSAGILRALDGIPCATVLAKDGEEIDFPSYPTSIKTRGIHNFPSSGICSITIPLGFHFVFSYTGKIETSVQTNALTGIIWHSTHSAKVKPLESVDMTSGVSSVIINYLGTAPILITNANNKIDFSITIEGVTTSHTATIQNGGYSATLMDFNKAFNKAMQTAKPIEGKYFISYDEKNRIWNIGADGKYVSKINFLFLSGVNSSASLASTFGFENKDYIDLLYYTAKTEKNHSSCLAFQKGPVVDYTSPKIRFENASSGTEWTNSSLAKLESFVGWRQSITYSDNGPSGLTYFFPSKDAVGVELTFEGGRDSATIYVNVDNRIFTRLELAGQVNDPASNYSPIYNYFLTFPKGARLIEFYATSFTLSEWGNTSGSNLIRFQFLKELFCRPPIEQLNKDEKIIKTFDIAPKQFYENFTGLPASGPYIPQGGADPIKNWTHVSTNNGPANSILGYHSQYFYAQDSYVEFQFVLSTDGGGFSYWGFHGYTTAGSYINCYVYLSTSPINEATDLYATWSPMTYEGFRSRSNAFLGLKAGTYYVRFKRKSVASVSYYLYLIGFSIIDAPLSRTATRVTQMPLNFKSIPIPVNKFMCDTNRDDEVMATSSEFRTMIDPQIYNLENLLVNTGTYNQTIYWNKLKTAASYALATYKETGIFQFYQDYSIWAEVATMSIGQDFCFSQTVYTTYSTSMPIAINGIIKENANQADPIVKGGSFYNDTSVNSFVRNSFNWEQVCTFSSGDTFNCPLTLYLKIGADIILYDDLNFEQVTILSIITNSSFTCTKRSIVVDANVTYLKASGYQPVRIKNTVAAVADVAQLFVTPLPISYSTFTEKFVTKEIEIATANYVGLPTGTNKLSFPIFKDGTRGNASNTTGTVTTVSNAATYYSLSIASQITAVVTGGGAISLILTSTRK